MGIQMKELRRLRDAWAAKGDPPCDHQEVDKEYDLGGQTGDYGCAVCGECPVERPARPSSPAP